MLKIVIAEDAAIEREGLIKNIDWASLGIEVVGAAEDGRQALELIQTHQPDILLTDIKMPLLDGIQLAKQVCGQYPSIKIVFFSGYEDFNFALKAIKSKVCEYILKPYTFIEITNVLRDVAELCWLNKSKLMEEERIRNELLENRTYRESKAFLSLLYGLDKNNRVIEELGLCDTKSTYVLMIARIVKISDNEENNEFIKQRNNIILENILSKHRIFMDGKLFIHREGEFFLLLEGEEQRFQNKSHLEQIGELLREWIRNQMNVELIVGISKPVSDPLLLAECYSHVLEILKLGTIMERVNIIFYDDKYGLEASTRMEKIVFKVKKVIDSRYMESITLKEVAQEVFMSPNHLNMIFKKITGKNINKYLTEVRVAKAAEQLQEVDAVIARVAENVGYKNFAHFSTLFKKNTGYSPIEYRDNRVNLQKKS